MASFKFFGMAVILSAAIATPLHAQEASQEPGLQAFYQSLGVGSQSNTTASAMASIRSEPVKRVAARHRASDHKM
jgi:hypothetical protein